MNKQTSDNIKKAAADKYNGDLDIAIAAHLMGDVVIDYCAGQIPAGADYDAIAAIRKEINAGGKGKPLGLQGGGKKTPKAKAAKRVAKASAPKAKKQLSRYNRTEALAKAKELGIEIPAGSTATVPEIITMIRNEIRDECGA